MKRVNSILFCLVCTVLLNFGLYSQKLLVQQPEIRITYIDNDSTRVYSFDNLSKQGISVISYVRKKEVFESEDTLKRDYILLGSAKTTIDKLQGLLQCDYTGAYDLIECRKVSKYGLTYLILSFADTFIMGTNQNVFYVSIKLENDNWKYLSSYENEADKPTDNIKVICSKKGLKLKGKYLKQIKRKGLDCLN